MLYLSDDTQQEETKVLQEKNQTEIAKHTETMSVSGWLTVDQERGFIKDLSEQRVRKRRLRE